MTTYRVEEFNGDNMVYAGKWHKRMADAQDDFADRAELMTAYGVDHELRITPSIESDQA